MEPITLEKSIMNTNKRSITLDELNKILESDECIFNDYIFDSKISNINASNLYDKSEYLGFILNNISHESKPLRLSFINCEFDIDFYLRNFEIYSDNIFMKNVIFNKKVDFSNLKFKSSCVFENVIFNDNVNFVSCIFFGSCHLMNVDFNNSVSFKKHWGLPETTFGGEAIFNCKFHGFCEFKDVLFHSVDFSKITIDNYNLEFSNVIFKHVAFFRFLNLRNNVFFKSCDLTNCSFLYSKFDEVFFVDCFFNYNNLIDERIYKNDVFRETIFCFGIDQGNEFCNISIEDIINTYRMFEINFDRFKNFELAGDFHIRRFKLEKIKTFKEYKNIYKKYKSKEIQSSLNTKKLKINFSSFIAKISSTLFKQIVLNLYGWFSSYGESYFRSCLFFTIFILLFGFFYSFTGIETQTINRKTSKIDTILIKSITWKDVTSINKFAIKKAILYSINNSFPFKKADEKIYSYGDLTTFFSYSQTAIQSILLTLFIISLRRRLKR